MHRYKINKKQYISGNDIYKLRKQRPKSSQQTPNNNICPSKVSSVIGAARQIVFVVVRLEHDHKASHAYDEGTDSQNIVQQFRYHRFDVAGKSLRVGCYDSETDRAKH